MADELTESIDRLREETEGWAGRVLRISDEREATTEPASGFWGPWDLIGTYHNRERIEALLSGDIPYSVRAVDELLRTFSEPIGASWVNEISPADHAGHGWWWRFVPRDGPLRLELDERLS